MSDEKLHADMSQEEAFRLVNRSSNTNNEREANLIPELARRSNVIGHAAALLDTGHVNEARDVLRVCFANETPQPASNPMNLELWSAIREYIAAEIQAGILDRDERRSGQLKIGEPEELRRLREQSTRMETEVRRLLHTSPNETCERQRLMEALYARVGGWLQSDCTAETWRVIGTLRQYFPQAGSNAPSEKANEMHFESGVCRVLCLPSEVASSVNRTARPDQVTCRVCLRMLTLEKANAQPVAWLKEWNTDQFSGCRRVDLDDKLDPWMRNATVTPLYRR